MDITFDRQANALYIRFQPRKRAKRTIKLREGLLVDVDRAGHLFGIEILDVTQRIPIAQLGHVTVNLPVHA